MFEIDHDIPIPETSYGSARSAFTQALARLEVGDSILVDSYKRAHGGYRWARRNGIEIMMRKTRDGVRVWRTE